MPYLPQIRILVPSAQVSSYTTGVLSLPSARGAFVPPLSRGVVFGGIQSTRVNEIEYIDITTTGNAVDFGDLSQNIYGMAGFGSSTRGVMGGGFPASGGSPYTANIEYITIATTGNAQNFGQLTVAGDDSGACSTNTRGLIVGGAGSRGVTIDYVTIATTGNATDFGDRSHSGNLPACHSSTTRGVFGGGVTVNVIDTVEMATTGNATDFGDLTVARYGAGGCGSSTRALFMGGNNGGIQNTIDYVTIATTGNAIDFGDLTVARLAGASACSSQLRGVYAGGAPASGNSNVIDYVTIATTGNATDFGDLTREKRTTAALSNCHGGI